MRDTQLHSSDSDVSVEDSSLTELPEETWSRQFISCGGLAHLFNIFLSGVLQQTQDNNQWNEVQSQPLERRRIDGAGNGKKWKISHHNVCW